MKKNKFDAFVEKWEKRFPVCVKADIVWNKKYIKQMLKEYDELKGDAR